MKTIHSNALTLAHKLKKIMPYRDALRLAYKVVQGKVSSFAFSNLLSRVMQGHYRRGCISFAGLLESYSWISSLSAFN